ncbi:MAG: OmpH family outer membrane protein [Cyclobacteriaceae bacterium]|nr:OmpH family outer membrane protein [Cyclobacteriaceae bacterium]
MKNLSYIINTVLAIALIILYVLHFSEGNSTEEVAKGEDSLSNVAFTVAYIRSDSLVNNYDFVKDQNDAVQKRTSQMEQDYKNRAESLQREFNEYQNNLRNLTIGQAKTIEEGLAKKEQNLRVFQESLRQELMQKEAEISRTLYTRVTEFLKEYSDKNNIQMVVKFDTQSDVLYAGEGLDITSVVLDELNKRYKEGDSVPSDSTKVE